MYKRSYLPILFIMYGFLQILCIIYGRISYGLIYLTASRYTFDTAFIWIGCSLILADELTICKNKIMKVFCFFVLIGFTFLLIDVNRKEFNSAVYRGVYKEGINSYILEIGEKLDAGIVTVDDLDSEKIAMFQASAQLVLQGIKFMHEHNLNVFRQKKLKPKLEIFGRWPDNWIEESVKINAVPKKDTSPVLHLTFFNPSNLLFGETIEVFENGILVSKTSVQPGLFKLEIPLSSGTLSKVEIKTNYRQKNVGDDLRSLSLILSDVQLVYDDKQGR